MKKHKAIRMCIVCKERFEQNSLHRFRIQKDTLCQKINHGRSVYLCDTCIFSKDKILQKAFCKLGSNLNIQIIKDFKGGNFNAKS